MANDTPQRTGGITPSRPGVSSQAGLAAARGPVRSAPSSPAPGQPGSRFNPVVRDRKVSPKVPGIPDMVTSADVPGPGSSVQPKRLPAGQRLKEKVGQVVQSEDFKSGVKRVGVGVMRDAGAEAVRAKQGGSNTKGVVASAAKGAAVGMARGLRTEIASRNDQLTQQGHDQETKGTPVGTDLVGRLGAVVGRAPEVPKSPPERTRQPLSERYDYQFEGQDQSRGVEQQHD